MKLRLLTCLTCLLLAGAAAPSAASASEPQPTGSSTETSSVPATTPPVTDSSTTPTASTTSPPTVTETSETPQVKAQLEQTPTPASTPAKHRQTSTKAHAKNSGGETSSQTHSSTQTSAGRRAPAPLPSAVTPPLPSTLSTTLSGVPDFFVNSFAIPPFLLPIYQAAGSAYGIPWQVLAAINEVETDYGRDLSVSSAGAEGWMQFLPSSWAQYGVDATAQGYEDPYNPADAIFAAARYLKAAGGDKDIRAAVYAYNHSQAYVASVMLRAQLLGGTPPGLLSAITGLTEARFPVHAPSHFADGFPVIQTGVSSSPTTVPATVIYSQPRAPVIAVQDGVITEIGSSPTLGRFISLRDTFGNTYTYAQLGSIATLYPVLELRGSQPAPEQPSTSGVSPDSTPEAPASAGVQPRSPMSSGAVSSSLAFGAAAGFGSAQGTGAGQPAAKPTGAAPAVREFRAGSDDVYLRPLKVGVQVIAGTVLGHVASTDSSGSEPHMFFQIRPAGPGSPLIDPKPILDGWVLLESTSAFRANGANPFVQAKPAPGQALLESKNQLEQQLLRNAAIHLNSCGRGAVQTGQVDRRVLATLEFLAASDLRLSISLECAPTQSTAAGTSSEHRSDEQVNILAVNGLPVAGHSSIVQTTIDKLLSLQGSAKPLQLTSPVSQPGATNVIVVHGPYTHIHVGFLSPYFSNARFARTVNTVLSPSQWIKLISRLGEIPNPQVGSGPSAAAIPDSPSKSEGR